MQIGTVVSVNMAFRTVTLDVGAHDRDGNPVYLVDVLMARNGVAPKIGDKVSILEKEEQDERNRKA